MKRNLMTRTAIYSKQEIADFMAKWPCSNIPKNQDGLSLRFAKNGDLLSAPFWPNADFEAIGVLVQDARKALYPCVKLQA